MSGFASLNDTVRAWSENASLQRKVAYVLVIAAVVSGGMTVATLTGNSTTAVDVKTVLNLIYVDGAILLLLALLVAKKLVTVWQERRSGQAGAGLHVRLMMMFGLVATKPQPHIG